MILTNLKLFRWSGVSLTILGLVLTTYSVTPASTALAAGPASAVVHQSTRSKNQAPSAHPTAAYDPAIAATLPPDLRHGVLRDISYAAAFPSIGVMDGKLTGWEAQIGEAVAVTLGMSWHWSASTAFDTFIPSIQNGRYNVSFTSFIVTPQRLTQVDIIGVFRSGTTFATRRDSHLTIRKLTDLCGHSVAVIAGSAYIAQISAVNAACAKLKKPSPAIHTFPDQSSAALAVSSGRVQVFATLADQMGYYIQRVGHEFVESPLEIALGLVGPAVSKTSGLARPITLAISHLMAIGVYQAIMRAWGVSKGLVSHAVLYT